MNNKGLTRNTIIFLVGFSSFLLIPPLIFKLWGLFWIIAGAFIMFGIVELIWVLKYKRTVSKDVWTWGKDNKAKLAILLTSMLIGWGFLIWHFAERVY